VRVRPGYSGEAVPDFHRIPVHLQAFVSLVRNILRFFRESCQGTTHFACNRTGSVSPLSGTMNMSPMTNRGDVFMKTKAARRLLVIEQASAGKIPVREADERHPRTENFRDTVLRCCCRCSHGIARGVSARACGFGHRSAGPDGRRKRESLERSARPLELSRKISLVFDLTRHSNIATITARCRIGIQSNDVRCSGSPVKDRRGPATVTPTKPRSHWFRPFRNREGADGG